MLLYFSNLSLYYLRLYTFKDFYSNITLLYIKKKHHRQFLFLSDVYNASFRF
nr:MAG TPA: hypothetical protein [Bacteriophage sp.]